MRLLCKLVRYTGVSVISTTVSLTLLGLLVATGATTSGWANVLATAVGTVPSFELNRRWVWHRAGRRSLLAEIGPFCALSLAGLGLSTLAVSRATLWVSRAGMGASARALAAEAAHVGAFGALWVFQFVMCDRFVFTSSPSLAPASTQLEDQYRMDREAA